MWQLEKLENTFLLSFSKTFDSCGFFNRKNISCPEPIFWGGSPQAINPSTLDLCSWVTPIGL
jgi:hypothetical protein